MFEIALLNSFSASSFQVGVTTALIAIERFIDIEFLFP